jgi:hypothetical protein
MAMVHRLSIAPPRPLPGFLKPLPLCVGGYIQPTKLPELGSEMAASFHLESTTSTKPLDHGHRIRNDHGR